MFAYIKHIQYKRTQLFLRSSVWFCQYENNVWMSHNYTVIYTQEHGISSKHKLFQHILAPEFIGNELSDDNTNSF